MSNQNDRFAGGFVAGAIFGGIVGSVVGSWLATRLPLEEGEEGEDLAGSPANLAKEQLRRIRQRMLQSSDELNIEEARQGLEEKISQLNDAIDQAREQLSHVNGTSQEP